MTSRVEQINGAVDSVFEVVEHTAASLAIPVADGVVSWLAAENMVRALGFSWPVSIMTGVALEGCGIVVSRAALTVRYFNQTHKGEPPALEWMAWALLVVQFFVGAVLVTVNTVATNSMLFGLLTLATLSAVGTLAHMLENDVKAREKSPSPAPVLAQPVIIEQPPSVRDRVLRYVDENPSAKQQEIAGALRISRQRVSQVLAELREPGDGNGRH